MRSWRVVLAWLLLAMSGGSVAAVGFPEELHYQVYYRGLFSAGARMPIADVTLKTRDPAGGAAYLESELGVTSEDNAHVEAFYPILYRFRSWYLRDRSSCLAAEYFERNNRSGLKHRLIYLDDPQEDFVTRDLVAEGDLDLPALLGGTYSGDAAATRAEGRFDRLGLLQRVRGLALQPGMQLQEAVSNGKQMLHYRVTVEQRSDRSVAGRQWAALKLRFEGLETDQRGKLEHAHRPVYIWLSDDAWRVPLLAVGRAAVGKFYIELKQPPGPKLVQLENG